MDRGRWCATQALGSSMGYGNGMMPRCDLQREVCVSGSRSQFNGSTATCLNLLYLTNCSPCDAHDLDLFVWYSSPQMAKRTFHSIFSLRFVLEGSVLQRVCCCDCEPTHTGCCGFCGGVYVLSIMTACGAASVMLRGKTLLLLQRSQTTCLPAHKQTNCRKDDRRGLYQHHVSPQRGSFL